MDSLVIPREVSQLSPTARLLYLVLEREPSLTRSELSARTGAAGGNFQDALNELRGADLITDERHPVDGRSKQFSVVRSERAGSTRWGPAPIGP